MAEMDPDYSFKRAGYYAMPRSELLPFVPATARRLLDVGCGEGMFAAGLRSFRPDLEVWGIEPMPEAAAVARQRLHTVLCGTVESNLEALPEGYFDCITFNDVLEHLSEPWTVLRQMRSKIAPGGCIVASMPNLRHWPVMKELVYNAEFRYDKDGVLDRTHLRFFTKKSMHRMIVECGYEVTDTGGLSWTRFPFMVSVVNKLARGAWDDMHYKQFAIQAKPA